MSVGGLDLNWRFWPFVFLAAGLHASESQLHAGEGTATPGQRSAETKGLEVRVVAPAGTDRRRQQRKREKN